MLGATRLSIIDLEGGRQPLTDESGLILATQNGEIYNYVELRGDLERRGHGFETRSDTETIVHLYEEYGTDFVEHLRGMFAIAIWDGRTGPPGPGPRPARQEAALLAPGRRPADLRVRAEGDPRGPEVERVVDRDALALYLQYQYVPAPLHDPRGRRTSCRRRASWSGTAASRRSSGTGRPAYEPKTHRDSEEDVEEGSRSSGRRSGSACAATSRSGVFLSGGMDSSVVTAIMAEESAEPVRTFSIGFENQAYDELPYARARRRAVRDRPHRGVVRLDAIELLPELADHYDEPFGDSSAIPTFRVSQIAAQHLKVVLTGDGGDESFGGYSRYRVARRSSARSTSMPSPLLRAAARSGPTGHDPAWGHDRAFRRRMRIADDLFGLGRRRALRPADDDLRQVRPIEPAARSRTVPPTGTCWTSSATARLEPIDRMLRADLLTYLPEDLLVKMDRATMANSLEARAPLLDHHLVEFAARLPIDRKIDGSDTQGAAALDREAAHAGRPHRSPEDGLRRRRSATGSGVSSASGSRSSCSRPTRASRDHLDLRTAERLLREHRTGQVEHEHQLWMLLMFELVGPPLAPADPRRGAERHQRSMRVRRTRRERQPGTPIRIAYLTPTLQPGGAERQMLVLAAALPRDRFDVRFIVLSERGAWASEAEGIGVPVHVLGISRSRHPIDPRTWVASLRALRRYIALTRRLDVVDAWLVPAFTFAGLARPLARIPVLIGGRRSLLDLYAGKPWYRRAAAALATRQVDQVVTNTQRAMDEAIEIEGMDRSRVALIPNAVLPGIDDPEERAGWRSAWGVATGRGRRRMRRELQGRQGPEGARRRDRQAAARLPRPAARPGRGGPAPRRSRVAGRRGWARVRGHARRRRRRRQAGHHRRSTSPCRRRGVRACRMPSSRRRRPAFRSSPRMSAGRPKSSMDRRPGSWCRPTTSMPSRGRSVAWPPIRRCAPAWAIAARERAGDFSVERLTASTASLYERLVAEAGR